MLGRWERCRTFNTSRTEEQRDSEIHQEGVSVVVMVGRMMRGGGNCFCAVLWTKTHTEALCMRRLLRAKALDPCQAPVR